MASSGVTTGIAAAEPPASVLPASAPPLVPRPPLTPCARSQNVFDNVADAIRILREITLLRLLKHPDMVDIKHIMLPSDPTAYKDLYVVFELMEASS